MSVAVAFKDFSLGYNRNPAVMRLHTEIAEGSLTAVVGPNGAGKSTLLKGVVGSLPPLSGKISLGTIESHDISYLPQQSEVDRFSQSLCMNWYPWACGESSARSAE